MNDRHRWLDEKQCNPVIITLTDEILDELDDH